MRSRKYKRLYLKMFTNKKIKEQEKIKRILQTNSHVFGRNLIEENSCHDLTYYLDLYLYSYIHTDGRTDGRLDGQAHMHHTLLNVVTCVCAL